MSRTALRLATLLALSTAPLLAQGAKKAEKLQDLELVGSWIHDDVAAGFAEAGRTGKPLLIVFR